MFRRRPTRYLLGGGVLLALLMAALYVALAPGNLSGDQANDVQSAEVSPASSTFAKKLCAAAIERTRHRVRYDPSYLEIDYPGGDVLPDRGVCSDVLIRAYRQVGIDLQEKVHQDMKKHFQLYPQRWGLSAPDPNIDHRRVPNLMTFFSRHGRTLRISEQAADYHPGDIIAWDLGEGVLHIGLAVDQYSRDDKRPLIVHNIGAGPQLEDVLFSWRIIGHYRYQGEQTDAD